MFQSFFADHYAKSYALARDKFVLTAANTGATIYTYELPGQLGPKGETLSVDCAYYGNPETTKKLMVMTSGLHGVEGHAGSAIQNASMKMLAGLSHPDIGMLYVHALNPWGYAYDTREDQDGIDLNRNFLDDFSCALPATTAFKLANEVICPRHSHIAAPQNIKNIYHVIRHAMQNGFGELQQHISQGQRDMDSSPYHCGTGPAWSNKVWHNILTQIVCKPDVTVHLDIHTGLGAFKNVDMMLYDEPGGSAENLAKIMFGGGLNSIAAACFEQKTPNVTASALIQGDITGSWRYMRPDLKRVMALTFEVGTGSKLQGFVRWRKRNWLKRNPDLDDTMLGRRIKRQFRDYFCPRSPSWRDENIAAGTFAAMSTINMFHMTNG